MTAILFLKRYWKLILGVLVIGYFLVTAYGKGYTKADTQWQSKWDKEHSRLSQELAAAQQAARERETYWVNELDKVSRDAQITIDKINNDAGAAVVAANSLRQSAENLAKRASKTCKNTTVTDERETADPRIMVLANVLASIDKRAGELAEAADRSRAAGIACERSYDSLRF